MYCVVFWCYMARTLNRPVFSLTKRALFIWHVIRQPQQIDISIRYAHILCLSARKAAVK